jgi:hypothetical protein
MKRLLQGLVVVFLFCSAVSVLASEIAPLTAKWEIGKDDEPMRRMVDKVLCIDGLKVFQTVAFGYGDGSGAAVSNIQLYEEKNGKVVPVRCSPAK